MKPLLLIISMSIVLVACGTDVPSVVQSEPTDSAAVTATSTTLPTIAPTTESVITPSSENMTGHNSSIDGMPQVYVPAGDVRMGGLDVHADNDEMPAHTVSLNAFWIDQLEVTNAMYLLCVQAGECDPPANWASEKRSSYFNNQTYKDYPVIQVTWEQANTYCGWAGRRLPTEAQWERAARGDDFRTFPWGDEPPSEIYANYNRLVGDTSRVGSYAAGASPFGALDMAGNVWEWTIDYFSTQYYASSPLFNPSGPIDSANNRRVIRGGSYQDEWIDIRVSKRGSALGPNPNAVYEDPLRGGEHSSKIGFRCTSE
jgi:formylglycine-generating enzyme required for sulfatase activity